MRLLLFGTALAHEEDGYQPSRYNLANAYLHASIRSVFKDNLLQVRRLDQSVDLANACHNGVDPTGEILAWNPNIVGLSCYVWDYGANMALARRLKSQRSDILVIAGGPEVSVAPRAVLEENPAVDVAVYGEGEETIVELLKAPPRDFSGIRGLVWRREDQIIIDEGKRDTSHDLSGLASPLLSGVLVPPDESLYFLF